MTETDQPAPSAERPAVGMQVKIDLNGISGRVSRDLQRIILLTAAGLQNIDKIDTDNLSLPVGLKIQIQQDQQIPKEEFSEEFREWILTCGLRDAIEAVSAAIEEAHNVLSLWEVTDFQPKQVKILGQAWLKIVVKGAKDFHRFGLPVKLRHFMADHDVALADNLIGHLISINTVRNCLVHRGGVVTDEDVTEPGLLKVTWRATDLFIETENGEKPVVIGEVIEESGMLSMRFSDTEKTFQIGSRVKFTAEEFSEICWTLILFAMHLGEKMTDLGVAKGALEKPVPAAASHPTAATGGP